MSSRPPRVTVIVPTYNSGSTLGSALGSVLLQDFPDFELWVVGDGCTDDSAAVVASLRDERVRWMNLPRNTGGPSIPRREGVRRARGSLVAYLGHDDLWFPWHLSGLVGTIDRTGGDFAYSIGAIVGPEGLAGMFTMPERGERLAEISPTNWLHRRDLVAPIEAWWPDLRHAVDVVFLERLGGSGARLAFHRELSAIKYPARSWHGHGRPLGSPPPQIAHLEAIRRDPRGLSDTLLVDLAVRVSQRGRFLERRGGLLPKRLRELAWCAARAYGLHRWPASSVLGWARRRRPGLDKAEGRRG